MNIISLFQTPVHKFVFSLFGAKCTHSLAQRGRNSPHVSNSPPKIVLPKHLLDDPLVICRHLPAPGSGCNRLSSSAQPPLLLRTLHQLIRHVVWRRGSPFAKWSCLSLCREGCSLSPTRPSSARAASRCWWTCLSGACSPLKPIPESSVSRCLSPPPPPLLSPPPLPVSPRVDAYRSCLDVCVFSRRCCCEFSLNRFPRVHIKLFNEVLQQTAARQLGYGELSLLCCCLLYIQRQSHNHSGCLLSFKLAPSPLSTLERLC